ncbi:hypothetical protein B0H19DRAFT_1085312 [Mycena capillaripes]|nr:hypothetical protein B0H19DRAFT_1085312 [Mycena capillaripes]
MRSEPVVDPFNADGIFFACQFCSQAFTAQFPPVGDLTRQFPPRLLGGNVHTWSPKKFAISSTTSVSAHYCYVPTPVQAYPASYPMLTSTVADPLPPFCSAWRP